MFDTRHEYLKFRRNRLLNRRCKESINNYYYVKKKEYLSFNNLRDYVTVIETINVDEIVINEILILLKRDYLKRFYYNL